MEHKRLQYDLEIRRMQHEEKKMEYELRMKELDRSSAIS
jgi:hypothetical protein